MFAVIDKSVIKRNLEVIYAVLLIIFIPAAIIANTWIFTNSFGSVINQELYSKGVAIGDTINAGLMPFLKQPESIQTQLEHVGRLNSEVVGLDVLQKENDEFKVIASLDRRAINKTTKYMQYVMAWQEDNSIAYVTAATGKSTLSELSEIKNDGIRYWQIIMPIRDQLGQKQLLLSMRVSMKMLDDLTSQVLFRSYGVLAITVLLIIFVLLNNTRLFAYASLYKKIKEIDQMKDEFISVASHELRTPVTGIRGFVSMILAGDMGPIGDKTKQSLQIVQSSADRLAGLVEDLLNVSRIEQGRLSVDIKPTDIDPIMKSIIAEMKIQSDAKNLLLEYKPQEAKLSLVNVDTERLKQILINLIGNSIKYTEKGKVEVFVEEKDKNIEIKIKDTGIGMSPKARERLFEKFYRVQTEQTKNIVGTGLGLWITKQLIELQKGKITVDSIEGVGSQFVVTFPMAK
jgi:signal transduction histidine kinase